MYSSWRREKTLNTVTNGFQRMRSWIKIKGEHYFTKKTLPGQMGCMIHHFFRWRMSEMGYNCGKVEKMERRVRKGKKEKEVDNKNKNNWMKAQKCLLLSKDASFRGLLLLCAFCVSIPNIFSLALAAWPSTRELISKILPWTILKKNQIYILRDLLWMHLVNCMYNLYNVSTYPEIYKLN